MRHEKTKPVAYRRKRKSRTNYAKRLRLLESQKPRLAVRMSNQSIRAQLITFTPSGDRVVAAVDPVALRKLGWGFSCKNLPAAYLMGVLAAQAALAKGYKEAIFDTGFVTPLSGGRLFAFLQGAIDAGLNIPHGEEAIFPSPERLRGQHIATYSTQFSGKTPATPQFAQYLKTGLRPESLPEQWEALCKKLGVSVSLHQHAPKNEKKQVKKPKSDNQ